MSDNEANRRRQQQIERELAEVNEVRNRYQKQLDAWWRSQRDLYEEEDDLYEVGGFVEYHSRTPSFHKSRRDRDWRVR